MNKFFLTSFVLCLFAACVPVQKETYLQGKNDDNRKVPEDQVVSTYNSKDFEYKLKPEDIVSIKVSSATPGEFDFLNFRNDRTLTGLAVTDPLLAGFMIDEAGMISLPVIGKVEIQGLTVLEARDKLQKVIADYLESPTVDVKLLSFHYTILGEVKNQGRYTVYNNKLNILEAIGSAGGLNDFADRSKIKIVRKEGNKIEVAYVNVLEEDLLASPYYYLRPNDVISVPPLEAKNWRLNKAANLSLIISGITALGIILNWAIKL